MVRKKNAVKRDVLGGSIKGSDFVPANLVEQMEAALLAGESYAEFSNRTMKQMGITDTSATGVLRDWIIQLSAEAATAWNEAMVRANQAGEAAGEGGMPGTLAEPIQPVRMKRRKADPSEGNRRRCR